MKNDTVDTAPIIPPIPGQEPPEEVTPEVVENQVVEDETTEVENPILPTTNLSSEEQRDLLLKRRHMPLWVSFIKYFTLTLVFLGIFASAWLIIDLDKDNTYLSLLNANHNVETLHKELSTKQRTFEKENEELEKEIALYQEKLETESYYVFEETINGITNEQITWFDRKNEDGTLEVGVLESMQHMADYFNTMAFPEGILSAKLASANAIDVTNISANREEVTFSVETSQLFGKVFYLSTQFVEMMNSFPYFRDGEIRSFARKDDEAGGGQGMQFSMRLKRQLPGEVDLDDSGFSDFQKWTQSLTF